MLAKVKKSIIRIIINIIIELNHWQLVTPELKTGMVLQFYLFANKNIKLVVAFIPFNVHKFQEHR